MLYIYIFTGNIFFWISHEKILDGLFPLYQGSLWFKRVLYSRWWGATILLRAVNYFNRLILLAYIWKFAPRIYANSAKVSDYIFVYRATWPVWRNLALIKIFNLLGYLQFRSHILVTLWSWWQRNLWTPRLTATIIERALSKISHNARSTREASREN